MIRQASSLALLFAVAFPAVAQEAKPGPEFSAEGLTRRFAETLQPALEEVLGAKLGEPVLFTLQTAEGMAEVIESENIVLLGALEGGLRGEELAAQCKLLGQQMAPMVLGKIDLETGGLMVAPNGFSLLASVGGDAWAGINTQPFVDVVLVHEAVHVYQHRTYDLAAFMGQPKTVGEMRGRMSVIEGHAQWVTRQVADKLGLSDSFALFNAANTEVPPSITNEAVRTTINAQVAVLAFPYIDGAKFVTALIEELGVAPALERMFKSPPTTMRQVSRYQEYLHPPKNAIDLGALAKRIKVLFDDAEFQTLVVPLPESSIRQALGLAGPDAVDAALETYLGSTVCVANLRARPAEQVIVLVADLQMPAGSAAMLEVEEIVAHEKDEQIRKPDSGIALVSADYEDGLNGSGFYVRKVVNAPTMPEPLVSRSLIFTVDRFLIELVYIRIDGDGAAARTLGAKIAAVLGAKSEEAKHE